MADRLGVTTRTLLNLDKMGLPRTGEGATARYLWPAGRDWYNEYLREQAEKTAGGDELEAARTRKWQAEAKRAEYELAKIEGQMVTVEDMERELETVLQRLRGKLLSLASKLAPSVIGCETYADALAILEPVVAEIMDELRLDAVEADVA